MFKIEGYNTNRNQPMMRSTDSTQDNTKKFDVKQLADHKTIIVIHLRTEMITDVRLVIKKTCVSLGL
jgi:hypothetical protein